MTNGTDTAFPNTATKQHHHNQAPLEGTAGMTKREYFAAMAMSNWEVDRKGIRLLQDDVARPSYGLMAEYCVHFADALIDALNKEPK